MVCMDGNIGCAITQGLQSREQTALQLDPEGVRGVDAAGAPL